MRFLWLICLLVSLPCSLLYAMEYWRTGLPDALPFISQSFQ